VKLQIHMLLTRITTVIVTVLHVSFWFGHFSWGVVSICYITLGCVSYRVTYALSDDNRNTPVCIVYQRADAVRTLSRDI